MEITNVNRIALEIAKQIEEELGVNVIVQKLIDLPAQIRHQQTILSEARKNLTEKKAELELQEALIAAEISGEINPATGKAAFSNAEARKAELEKRKAESSAYQEALKIYSEAESEVNSAQFDLDQLLNEFSASKARAEITAARLNIRS